jgi:hypothetical protein
MYSKRQHPRAWLLLLASSACSPGARDAAPAAAPAAPRATPPPAFTKFPCAPGSGGDAPPDLELRHRGDALHPALELDYLAVRRLVRAKNGDAPALGGSAAADWSQLASIAQRGSPCAGAMQADTCKQALEQLDARFANDPGALCTGVECPGFTYVVTSKGDEVAAWSTPAELERLLGAIDTPSEAWLMAQVAAHAGPYLCGEDEFAAQRTVAGGFELRERRYTSSCHPLELGETIYRVSAEGAVKTSPRSVVRSEPDGCASSGDDVQGPAPETPTGKASGSTVDRPSAAP